MSRAASINFSCVLYLRRQRLRKINPSSTVLILECVNPTSLF